MTDLVHSGSASIPGGDEAAGASMLVRAARALAAEDARDRGVDLYNKNPGLYLRLARAVLMAVREPDGDMLGAGDKVFNHGCHGSTWTAMIDAILADGEGR